MRFYLNRGRGLLCQTVEATSRLLICTFSPTRANCAVLMADTSTFKVSAAGRIMSGPSSDEAPEPRYIPLSLPVRLRHNPQRRQSELSRLGFSNVKSTEGYFQMAETQVSIRIDLESGGRIGPGKIALLETIRKTGSITAAAQSMQMSYRRAWLLVDELNKPLSEPVVTTAV